jgi:hypothetical protein
MILKGAQSNGKTKSSNSQAAAMAQLDMSTGSLIAKYLFASALWKPWAEAE